MLYVQCIAMYNSILFFVNQFFTNSRILLLYYNLKLGTINSCRICINNLKIVQNVKMYI